MRALVAVALLAGVHANAGDQVGDIELFGYKGLDVAAIRKALPVHPGDEYSDRTKSLVREAVSALIGKELTDVAAICCDEQGNRLLFVGLPGASFKSFAYNPEPQGEDRLPADIINLYSRLEPALEAAVRRGGEAAEEDDSNGYALVKDPKARALQLDVRSWAVRHEDEALRVLQSSSGVDHRRVAADALGYANQSRRQILALVNAARDPDDEVRNNATRALSVLVRSDARLGREIPTATFVQMMNSGLWTDRNKAASLLMELTAGRDADLLTQLRTLALDSLIEMASWRRPSHAYFARMLLGRIAGLPEERLAELAWNGPVEVIIEAAHLP